MVRKHGGLQKQTAVFILEVSLKWKHLLSGRVKLEITAKIRYGEMDEKVNFHEIVG